MGLLVEARDQAVVRTSVDDVGICGVGNDKACLTAADVVPIRAIDCAIIAAAGDRYRGIVLLSAINTVREGVVRRHVIELRSRLIPLSSPGFSVVMRNRGAPVVGIYHPFRMRGIDPQAMVITMRRANKIVSVAAIGGTVHRGVQHINCVDIFGIGENVMEIPGALRKFMIWIEQLPGIAGVVTAINTAFFGFDDGVNAIAVGTGNRDANAAEHAGGKSMAFKAFP